MHTLFPTYEMTCFFLPKWFVRMGFSKNKPLVTMLRASWKLWAQAEDDGLSHIAPIIVAFNAPPAEIRQRVGGHVWHQIRTASQFTNANRMALRLLGGWTFEEAMEWPAFERAHAAKMLKKTTKSVLLIACRHTQQGDRLFDHVIVPRDVVRMGGTIDPSWGRKRLKREHDALALDLMLKSSDPTPWADPWFADIDGYTFKLLKSETDLAVEGMTQKHCCKSYTRQCRRGIEAVFSISGPERATASWNSKYGHLQVKGFANRNVKPETLEAARKCFAAYEAARKEHNQ